MNSRRKEERDARQCARRGKTPGPGSREGEFALFASAGASPGTFTQMAWEVEDIEITVADLRARGVIFEDVDVPGLRTVNGIAEIGGNYPSKGSGERAAWFRDSEGNMLGISRLVT